jgi:hypothetical protein
LNLARAVKSGGLRKDDIGRGNMALHAITLLGIDPVQLAKVMNYNYDKLITPYLAYDDSNSLCSIPTTIFSRRYVQSYSSISRVELFCYWTICRVLFENCSGDVYGEDNL